MGVGDEGVRLVYEANPKHKRGVYGGGPARHWRPSRASTCPEHLDRAAASRLLDRSELWKRDPAAPHPGARFALDPDGTVYKAYSSDGGRTWHGFPVPEGRVHREVPTAVLRAFVRRGELDEARYRRLVKGR